MAGRQLQAVHSLSFLPPELRHFTRQVYQSEQTCCPRRPPFWQFDQGKDDSTWLGESPECCRTGREALELCSPTGMENRQKIGNPMSILKTRSLKNTSGKNPHRFTSCRTEWCDTRAKEGPRGSHILNMRD